LTDKTVSGILIPKGPNREESGMDVDDVDDEGESGGWPGHEDRWWLPDSPGHRAYQFSQPPYDGETVDWLGMDAIVIKPEPPDGFWCDWCNDPIPVYNDEGKVMFMPMAMSNGLCPACFMKVLRGDPTTPRRLKQYNGRVEMAWSTRTCGCPPCTKKMEELIAEGKDRGKVR
jgi:hypothetical protein